MRAPNNNLRHFCISSQKKNNKLISPFLEDICSVCGIIHPTASGLKWVQNTHRGLSFTYFVSPSPSPSPSLSSSLSFSCSLAFQNHFSFSMILLDFQGIDCGILSTAFRREKKNWVWQLAAEVWAALYCKKMLNGKWPSIL